MNWVSLSIYEPTGRDRAFQARLAAGAAFDRAWGMLRAGLAWAGQLWDNHDDQDINHRRLAEQCDQTIGALLKDLEQRGLLDETFVIWGGEFGRTPTVESPKPGTNSGRINGRDHNHYGFTMWMAGGGVKGGTVYGVTGEFGFKAEEKPVHVHDLHATILALLGFDHEKLAGRDSRLTGVRHACLDIRNASGA